MRWPGPLRSLENRSLRLFFAGQTISLAGTWMQSVAQGWLVWRLTHSSLLLGLVGFLGQLPVSLLGVWAGSLADRYPRRRLVLATQANAIVQATLLAAVTLLGAVQPWHVLVLATMLGLTYAFEIPARQALLADVAGEDMPNAIALNASIVNAGRAVGPALAGWAVATVGEGWCFALNALSFLGTFYALWVMKVPPQAVTAPGGHRAHLREGLRYAWAHAARPRPPPPARLLEPPRHALRDAPAGGGERGAPRRRHALRLAPGAGRRGGVRRRRAAPAAARRAGRAGAAHRPRAPRCWPPA